MKGYNVHHSWEHVVTTFLPCECCNELKAEKDLAPKSSYIYGEGWLKLSQCCQTCFDKRKAELQANVKVNWQEQF